MTENIEALKDKILANKDSIPKHIAIIMDGNGRWAEKQGKPRTFGHEAGVTAVREVVKAASDVGVKYLTLYTFSIQNWNRPKDEVSALMSLLSKSTTSELAEMIKNDVKLRTIGHIHSLPTVRRVALELAVAKTKKNKGLILTLALNYGGRTEILDAVKALANSVRSGLIDLSEIDADLFSDFLYTSDMPDPDLMIRTSGEQRISNFLLWQTSYTELYIIDTLWPDFQREEMFKAILDYQTRERRFGKVSADQNE